MDGYTPKTRGLADPGPTPRGGTGARGPKTPKSEEDRVWVSVSRKVNLARFEMLEVGCGSSVSVREGETVSGAIKRVAAEVLVEHAEILEVLREDYSV